MRVALATSAWNQPWTSFSKYSERTLAAVRTVGVEAFALPLPASRSGLRVGGLALPWIRQNLFGYRTDADVIHHTSPDARRGVDVVTIQDVHPFYAEGFTEGLYRAAIRRSVHRARRVVVTNEANVRDLARWIPESREKLRVVPIPHAATDAHRSPTRYDGLWVGRHAPHKRLLDYLRLAEQLPDRRFAVRWTYGAGRSAPDETLERTLARAANVTQLPELTDAELDAMFRQSLTVVSTSRREGWHLPVTEGYLRGCRVVLPRVEPYLSIFPESLPFWYVPDETGATLREAFLSAVSTPTPVAPDPSFVRSLMYPQVGGQFRAVYEELVRG